MGIGAVAFNTFREAVRSKAYYVLVVAGIILMALWVLVPFFSQGSDLGLLKEMELGTLTVLGVLMGILLAGTVVSNELEDLTAMTLLTKPISRSQFVMGKFWGVMLTVLSAMAVLSVVLLFSVWLKAYMELEPRGAGELKERLAQLARDRWTHVGTVLPGLALAAMQVAVVTAVAVALSVRLPMAINALTVVGLYLLGHLLPRLKVMVPDGSVGKAFLGGVCWLLPSLEQYDVGNAIAFGYEVPWGTYVLRAAIYTVLYGAVALLVAMALFRERELT
jgi:hypothetical protein